MFNRLNFRKWQPTTLALWASFFLPALLMLGYFAARQMAPFGSSSILTVDLGQQYVDFFAGFKHALLHDPLSVIYSFAKGLGGETYGDWAYYLLSPTNLLLLPFSNADLPVGILLLTVLKYGLAGWSFAYALRLMRWQKGWVLPVFAVSYAMMGWFVANELNLLWLDAAILLPLIIAGFERFLTGQNPWRYILPFTAVIVINYYMAYMIGLFLVLYFLWRLTWEKNGWRGKLTYLGRFTYGTIVSIGIATVVWLPTAYTLLNSKGQHMLNDLTWKFEYTPADILGKFFLGTFNFEQMPEGLPNIFVGSFALIAVWFFFTMRQIRWQTKLVALLITGFLVVSMMYAPLDLVWHGFQFPVWYPYRFSYLFSFWLLWLGASVWSPDLRMNWLQIGAILAITVATIVYLYLRLGKLNFLTQEQVMIGAIFFTAILALHVFSTRSWWWILSLTILVVGEMFTSTIWTLNNFSYLTNTEYKTYITALQSATNKLPQSSKDFYRVAQSFQRTKGDPLQGGYFGASTFSSALEHQQSDFMAAIGQPEGDNYITYDGGTLVTDSLLGMRYLLQPSGQQADVSGTPTNMRTYPRTDTNRAYTITKQNGQVLTSENPNALPLVCAASPNVMNVRFKENDPLGNQSKFWSSLLGYSDTTVFTSENFSSATTFNAPALSTITGAFISKTDKKQPASLTLTYTPSSDDPYYLTLGANITDDNTTIDVNGQALPNIPSHRHTIVVPLAGGVAGQQQTITIHLKGDSLWLQNFSLYKLNSEAVTSGAAQLQQNGMTYDKVSQTEISGSIKIPNGQNLMMTTIPYATGWHVYVDGKEVTPVKIGKFFIGVNLETGTHDVQFKFQAPYLKWGGVASIGFLLFAVGLTWSESERRRHSLFGRENSLYR
jgi:uncharacterized membrane protein YfhO